MTVHVWKGDDVLIAQVTTFTVDNTWATNDTASLTIGKTLTVTVGSSTGVNDVANAIVAAFNGDNTVGTETRDFTGDLAGEFENITASAVNSTVTLTADSGFEGIPFILSVAENTAGNGSLGTPSNTTAARGPNILSANNITNGLPGASDDFWIDDSSVSLLWTLGALSGTLTSLHVTSGFTGAVGLPKMNTGGTDFDEYRTRELTLDCSAIFIGEGDGTGSARIQINSGTVQTAVTVLKTASSAEDEFHAFVWRGTHVSNTFFMQGGTADVAAFPGHTATIATLSVSNDAQIRTSSGTALTTVNIDGSSQADIDASGTITTLNVRGTATCIYRSSQTITACNVKGSGCTFDHRGSGTITTLVLGPSDTLDAQYNTSGFTITNAAISPGATINDPHNKITWSNAYTIPGGGPKDITHNTGDASVLITYP